MKIVSNPRKCYYKINNTEIEIPVHAQYLTIDTDLRLEAWFEKPRLDDGYYYSSNNASICLCFIESDDDDDFTWFSIHEVLKYNIYTK